MKSRVLISSILVILSAHLLMLSYTEYSFVGYLSDITVPVLLIITLFVLLRRSEIAIRAKNIFVSYSVVITIFYGVVGISTFANQGMFVTLNATGVCGFHYYKIDNNFYNGYFEPVGAYSGGEGNIWITKTPFAFPIIEKTVFYEHAVLWDYSIVEFEDEKVDQKGIMRQTILNKLNSN